MIADRGAASVVDDGRRDVLLGRLELARQAVHVVRVVVRLLGVRRPRRVTRAAREVGRRGVVDESGKGPPGDAVAVHVRIAPELAEPADVLLELLFGPDHLAAIERLLGVGEGIGHPVVHAQVEVGHQEDRGLEALREVEGVLREEVALRDAPGEQQDVPAVAVGEEVRRKDVALHRAGGKARGGADALDVQDDRGHLGVVAQPGELGHERDAGPGRRRHRPRARPSRAEDHADRRELVLRLHDREGRLPGLRVHAVRAAVIDQGLGEGRGRRDRVPRDDRDARPAWRRPRRPRCRR